MREFVFELKYEPGRNPLMDVFDEYPDLSSNGIAGVAGNDELWRIERISGPTEGLDTAETCLERRPGAAETVTATPCEVRARVNVIKNSGAHRDVYTHFESVQGGDSVHTLATKHLGDDVVFEVQRTRLTQRWRIACPTDEAFGLFYDAFQGALHADISFRFSHVGQAQGWQANLFSGIDMPAEQRVALVNAVEHGYYESPREISLEELSTDLGWPRSTLSYRLRRAEARLAEAFAERVGSGDAGRPISSGRDTEHGG
ncbi:helix-turn-helix domain-containing protein [Natronomonas aquatica]|jgi:hypothetical protein